MTHTDKTRQGFQPVDSSHLESLGKTAARMAEAGGTSLNDAVTQTIGHEKLNSEQVRRVVEFTNIEAFNRKFAALEGPLRAVQIAGGPADPTQVLQSLNNDARPQEAVMESMDYAMPPTMGKHSSRHFEPTARTVTGVLGDVLDLQRKLAAAHDTLTQDAEAARYMLNESLLELVARAKTACLHGAAPGELYEAWFRVDQGLAKVAFERSAQVLPPSTTKTAGRRINPDHVVVGTFVQFAKHASAYTGYVTAVRNLELQMARVGSWLEEHGD